jgi:transcriptional regulator with XRE-family HTH domain
MGLRIKELRKAAGLSQQMLAEKSGISRSQLSEIETETKPANTYRLNALAKALNVEVDELFVRNAQEIFISELRDILEDVNDADRAAILQLAQSLARRG